MKRVKKAYGLLGQNKRNKIPIREFQNEKIKRKGHKVYLNQ